tara:strand:- start:1196 stop:1357 length:162 start_codon:yes stop_codon:yes gene_type:complete
MYGHKKKPKPVKKMKECPEGQCQHEVPKAVEESKKVKPKEVFGANYNKKSKKK